MAFFGSSRKTLLWFLVARFASISAPVSAGLIPGVEAAPPHPGDPSASSTVGSSSSVPPQGIHIIDLKGVSGKRFSGDRLRKSSVPLSFSNLKRSEVAKFAEKRKDCKKWIVVTSIFPPSKAVHVLADMVAKDWCFVVVGDVNGPPDYDDVPEVVYLTPSMQQRLHYHIVDHTPWKHFGRKNIGFLYAIEHGAEVIYDTDDDNRLKKLEIPYITAEDVAKGAHVHAYSGWNSEEWFARQPSEDSSGGRGPQRKSNLVINPYRDVNSTCPKLWPRGYPLDNINDEGHPPLSHEKLDKPPAIQQFLADEDPDVDAIYRLTGKLPCQFGGEEKTLLVPQGSFTPYNAQCVVHSQRAFWGMLLPVTVNGRVSDIWRSYITQRLLWDLDERVAFLPAKVDRVVVDASGTPSQLQVSQ